MISGDRPISIVIFGASGDLTQRKLVPALFNLYRKGRLPAATRICGVARRPYSAAQFAAGLLQGAQELAGQNPDPATWTEFARNLHYVRADFGSAAAFEQLESCLRELEAGPATPLVLSGDRPSHFVPLIEALGRSGMVEQDTGWRRIVIEKPFGHDLRVRPRVERDGARGVFRRIRVYRIDHYLGKETRRTSCSSVLPTRFSSRSGTASTSITVQITGLRRCVWGIARDTTRNPAFCATCSRTTCCNCSHWWRWSRRRPRMRLRCATRRSKCCSRSVRFSERHGLRAYAGYRLKSGTRNHAAQYLPKRP